MGAEFRQGVELRQGLGLGWCGVPFEHRAGPRRGDVQAWGGASA